MGFKLRNIGFSYGDQKIFSGLDLDFQAGVFHGILGPNGSGKTTLLDLLTGHKKPESGEVRFQDRNLASIPRKEMARVCALVPQDFQVNFPFTVFQVVMMGRYPHVGRFEGPSQDDVQIVEQAMEQADIGKFANRYVTELSGGERQRVVFARALAQNANVLILDEATSNLDVKHTLALMRLVEQGIRDGEHTTIAVMQDLNLAARFCSHLVFLKQGTVVAQGLVEEVLTEDTIQETFEVQANVFNDRMINRKQVVLI